jgi:hypothetical protein
MIAKKPKHETKVNKFIRSAPVAGTAKNGRADLKPIILKLPADLLDWLTAKAAEDSRPRTVYITRVLTDHRTQAERTE